MNRLHTFLGWLGAVGGMLTPVLVPAAHTYLAAHPTVAMVVTAVAAVSATVAAQAPGSPDGALTTVTK